MGRSGNQVTVRNTFVRNPCLAMFVENVFGSRSEVFPRQISEDSQREFLRGRERFPVMVSIDRVFEGPGFQFTCFSKLTRIVFFLLISVR